MKIGKSYGFPTVRNSSARLLNQKSDVTSSRLSKSMVLLSSVFMLALQLLSGKANATAIPTTSLTSSQTTTATTSCVNGFFASGWTSGTGYWLYTVNTTGYSGISMTFNTSSSGTGPTTGLVYYNTGSGDVLLTSYSVNTSCASKTIALPAACNNIAGLTVKLKMSGATNAGGTNRVPSNGGFDGTSSGCTGTPAAGSISASTTSICGSGNSVLTLTGATSGTGITYQWESASSGSGPWTAIPGANSLTYTTPTLTTTTFYHVVTTCASFTPATSAAQGITVNAIPSVAAITGVSASPMIVGTTNTLADATAGGVWNSSNTSVATVDPISGVVTAVSGGTTVISYLIDNGTCTNTATASVNVVWPNTLALYAGVNGNSTGVIAVPDETTGALTATNFGTPATPCGNGGMSGITVPVSFTSYDAINGPHVSYLITPNSGKALSVFRIHAVTRESGTGPAKARIAYRINGGSWIDEGVDVAQSTGGGCGAASNSWDFTPGLTINGITTNIEVAVFPFAPGAGTGTFQLNSLEVYGVVTDATPCSGTPVAGAVTPTSINICDSGARFLTYTGAAGVGISYQWQVSTDNVTFSDISGATNASYNTGMLHATTQNFYRVKVICSGGSTAFSVSDTVNVNSIPSASFTFGLPYLHIGTPISLPTYASPAGGWWSSNDTSSTSVDSASGLATGHIPGISIITYHVTTFGCTGVARDTIAAILPNTMAVYLGKNGNSTSVDFSSDVTPTALAQTGYGVVTPCGSGGMSGLTNNAGTYSSAGPKASFTLTSNNFVTVDGFNATVRSSATGPQLVRLAYSVNGGSWIDNGDQTVDIDACGYSSTNLSSGPLSISLIPFVDNVEFGVFGYAGTGGTFQINTIDITGSGASLKQGTTAVGNVNVAQGVQLYPNPTTDVLSIAANEKVNVSVMSIDGKLLMTQNDAKQINVSTLANGLYIVKVYNQNNTLIQTSKFTKQ